MSLFEVSQESLHTFYDVLELNTDLYEVPDAVPPIHTVSSRVATDKDPSK